MTTTSDDQRDTHEGKTVWDFSRKKDIEVFWAMIEPEKYPCDCRLWLGEWNDFGYGIWRGAPLLNPITGMQGKFSSTHESCYRFAYTFSPWRDIMDPCWDIRQMLNDGRGGPHIGHICGLAPCCNPLHLMPITRSQNSRDGITHRNLLQSFTEEQKAEIVASGIGFKELARTMDIPGGVAFKLIHGKLQRDNYPESFVEYVNLRWPKPPEPPQQSPWDKYPLIV